jgi:hypothetical protein
MPSTQQEARLAAVIFDIGGTLIYPATTDEHCIRRLSEWLIEQDWPESVEDALREARRWVLATTAQSGRQATMQEGIRRALSRIKGNPVDPALMRPRSTVLRARAGCTSLPGAVRLPTGLPSRLGRRMHLNATSHWDRTDVDHMGFRPFSIRWCRQPGRCMKPDPAIFRSVLTVGA